MKICFYQRILLLSSTLFATALSAPSSYGQHYQIPRDASEDYPVKISGITPVRDSINLFPASGPESGFLLLDEDNTLLKSSVKRAPKNDQKPSYNNYRTFQLLGQWHLVRDNQRRKEQPRSEETRKPHVNSDNPPGLMEVPTYLSEDSDPVVAAKLVSMPEYDPELILSSDDSKRNSQKPQAPNPHDEDSNVLDHNIFGFTSSHWGPLGKRDIDDAITIQSRGSKPMKTQNYKTQQVEQKWARLLSFYLKHPKLAKQVVAQQIAQPR